MSRRRGCYCPSCGSEIGIVRPSSAGGHYLDATGAHIITRTATQWRITCHCGQTIDWTGDEVKWRMGRPELLQAS